MKYLLINDGTHKYFIYGTPTGYDAQGKKASEEKCLWETDGKQYLLNKTQSLEVKIESGSVRVYEKEQVRIDIDIAYII